MKITGLVSFIVDYVDRHKHPTKALLHLAGVPAAFFGLYELLIRNYIQGLAWIVFGYLLQYLGHRAQGNEVGEITLIKSIWRRVTKRSV